MAITFKRATLEDDKKLYELGVLFNEYSAVASGNKEEFFWEGWEDDFVIEIHEELSNPLYYTYIAEDDETNEVAGYILGKLCPSCGHMLIDQFFVKDKYRGKRIGQTLVNMLIVVAKEHKVAVRLEVYEWNEVALNFYKKAGFKKEGVVMELGV